MALRASRTFCSAHAGDEVLCSASSSVFSCAIGLESTLNDISSQYLEDIICYTPVPARYATLYVSAVLDVPVRLPVTAHVPISLAKKNGGWSTAASLSFPTSALSAAYCGHSSTSTSTSRIALEPGPSFPSAFIAPVYSTG